MAWPENCEAFGRTEVTGIYIRKYGKKKKNGLLSYKAHQDNT